MATTANDGVSFKSTIVKIKGICQDDLDSTTKYNAITQLLRVYFDNEETTDVFEGFLRLFTFLFDYPSSVTVINDVNLSVQCLQVYSDFLAQKEEFDRDVITESMPDEKEVYLKALKIASTLKQKHLPKIASAFRLRDPKNMPILVKLVKHILKKDLPKSVEWIAFFNLRDAVDAFFNEIVCRLFLLNLPTALESFVGEERYRKTKLVTYFDELFSLEMKKFKGRNDSEEYALAETKRLEKFATKYMKLYEIPESCAPNILNYRTRSALLFHHYRWADDQMTLQNYEEIAIHAMRESAFICRFYLDFLCTHDRPHDALYFALRMGMTEEGFPPRLADYARANPDDLAKTKEKTLSYQKQKEENAMANEDCELPNGFPVHYVDDWQGMSRVIDMVKDEEVIGIDTEWKPHYANFKEHLDHNAKKQKQFDSTSWVTDEFRVALIQIACAKAVFLIDVVTLERRIRNDRWLEFFTAILCSDNCRKIGFDFANDLRVLKSSFPFLSLIAADTKHIVCLYRLLQQIVLTPKAEQLVFPDEKLSSIRLYDVAKLFMNIELDKSEQNSNWVDRPMRYEKKVYAAQDAYCLTGCFYIIAERLMKLDDFEILRQLQDASIVQFVEPRHPFRSKKMLNPDTGEYEIVGNSTKLKENDSEFVAHILAVTAELEAKAAARPEFRADFKSINDFSFVMDSMLFGLGAKLRKCGFNTELIGDREKLLHFCKENLEYIAVSTGKAFKKLEMYMPPERLLNVPINTNDPKLNSQLVAFIMRKLNITIHSQDLHSRCEKCNKRAFVRIARHIIKAIYYLNAVEKNLEFLEIGMTELRAVFADLFAHAATAAVTPDMLSEESDEYTVDAHDNQLSCRCRHCSIDVTNRLLLPDTEQAPIDLGQTMSIPRDALDDPTSQYYACGVCGKLHFIWPNQTAKEAELAAQKKQKNGVTEGAETPLPTTSAAADAGGINVKVVDLT